MKKIKSLALVFLVISGLLWSSCSKDDDIFEPSNRALKGKLHKIVYNTPGEIDSVYFEFKYDKQGRIDNFTILNNEGFLIAILNRNNSGLIESMEVTDFDESKIYKYNYTIGNDGKYLYREINLYDLDGTSINSYSIIGSFIYDGNKFFGIYYDSEYNRSSFYHYYDNRGNLIKEEHYLNEKLYGTIQLFYDEKINPLESINILPNFSWDTFGFLWGNNVNNPIRVKYTNYGSDNLSISYIYNKDNKPISATVQVENWGISNVRYTYY